MGLFRRGARGGVDLLAPPAEVVAAVDALIDGEQMLDARGPAAVPLEGCAEHPLVFMEVFGTSTEPRAVAVVLVAELDHPQLGPHGVFVATPDARTLGHLPSAVAERYLADLARTTQLSATHATVRGGPSERDWAVTVALPVDVAG